MTPDNPLQGILNYHAYNERLATAGQPATDQFILIKQAGFERIINLLPANSPYAVANEAGLVRQLGIEYIHIPVDFKSPETDDLEQFFKVMQQPGKKTFVHCALNWRVSCFIYLYRTLVCSENESRAKQDLDTIWPPNRTWQQFIKKAQSSATS